MIFTSARIQFTAEETELVHTLASAAMNNSANTTDSRYLAATILRKVEKFCRTNATRAGELRQLVMSDSQNEFEALHTSKVVSDSNVTSLRSEKNWKVPANMTGEWLIDCCYQLDKNDKTKWQAIMDALGNVPVSTEDRILHLAINTLYVYYNVLPETRGKVLESCYKFLADYDKMRTDKSANLCGNE